MGEMSNKEADINADGMLIHAQEAIYTALRPEVNLDQRAICAKAAIKSLKRFLGVK